jgi:DNA-binding transcriptional LysR family regulator
VRGEFDAAVLLMPVGWRPDVPCRADLILREPLLIVAPRRPRSPARAAATIDQLRDRAWVLNPDGCGFRHALAQSLAGIGHRLHVQFELDAAPQEHLAMVAAGLGCSIVPASALKQDATVTAHVQQLRIDQFDYELGVWALWSERSKPADGTMEALASVFALVHTSAVVTRPAAAHKAS